MIRKDEITNNINTDLKISKKYLNESRLGLCKYIVDISNQIDMYNIFLILSPTDITSISMVYSNYFFLKKSFINYDKLVRNYFQIRF